MKLYEAFLPVLATLLAVDAALGPNVSDESVQEDARLNFPDLARKYGYPVEIHRVVTPDGYVLVLHRIPYGRKCGTGEVQKTPVLLVHGILSSSISWIWTGPEKSLGYILADKCYDVWLGNNRGNHESREHKTLSISNPAYWDFSWHEMGLYDLPTFIDYVLELTKQPSLHYVGHSEGTTVFFVFNSLYPQYSTKIRSVQAMAPIAYVGRMKSPILQILSAITNTVQGLTNVIRATEFLPSSEILGALGRQACRDRYPAIQSVCSNVFFLLCGYDSEQLNTTLLPIFTGHTPAGASTKQLLHYGQLVQSGTFRQYDYSWFLNPLKYGMLMPPTYNLKNVLAPIALHYSLNDWLVDVQDLDQLASELPNVIGKFLVPFPKFNHLDYQWAIDVNDLVYDRLLEIMERY